MKRRKIECVVRPLGTSLLASGAVSHAQSAGNGLIIAPTQAILEGAQSKPSQYVSRRSMLKGTAFATGALLLPLGGVGLTGCEPATVQAILKIVKVGKEVFTVAEKVFGAIAVVNSGQDPVTLEVLLDMFFNPSTTSNGTLADGIEIAPTIPNDGLDHIVEWGGNNTGLNPGGREGPYRVVAQTGSQRRQADFKVS